MKVAVLCVFAALRELFSEQTTHSRRVEEAERICEGAQWVWRSQRSVTFREGVSEMAHIHAGYDPFPEGVVDTSGWWNGV